MRTIKVSYNKAYRIYIYIYIYTINIYVVMKYKRRNCASFIFVYDNVNNLTIKLRKSYNSLY